MAKHPEISVIMPAYNHAAYVGEAIESVLAQSYDNFEFIIVNDGSTDASEAVIQSYDDPRIRYFSQPNRGAHHALNRGLAQARGDYIAILNSDDVYLPRRLEVLLRTAHEAHLDFLITDIMLIDQFSHEITDNTHWWLRWYGALKEVFAATGSPAAALLAGNYAITSSNFLFRADLIDKIGLFRPFRYILDYDFVFRAALACQGGFAFLLSDKLLKYRLHGSNTIAENPLKANIETFYFLKQALARHFGDDIKVPLRHLSRLKGHMLKIQNARRYGEMDRLREDIHLERSALQQQIQGLLEHIGGQQGQIENLDRQLGQLAADNRQLSDELATAGHEAARLRNEVALLRNSLSFRLGWRLTAPMRWLRDHAPRVSWGIQGKAHNPLELRTQIETSLASTRVVSFDIFDTLLERDLDPPDEVKWVVARRVALTLTEEYGISLSFARVMEVRDQVEQALRRQALDAGRDHECKYSDIAHEWAAQLLGRADEGLAAKIVQHELQAEDEVLFVKRDLGPVLEWINGRGIRVIAISDMYLDHAHLQQLFESKGLHTHFDAIYVSSEAGVGKYSGRLFEHVLEQEGLKPEELLHIGDNHHSDYRSPSRLGIHAIHFDDKESLRRRLTLHAYRRLALKNPYWCGRHLLQLVRPGPSHGFHYDYGYRILGPIYATFMLGVIERLKKHAIRRVYFLAREGELFMRLFQVLAPQHFAPGQLPEVHYLHVSRRSTSTASAFCGMAYEPAVVPLFNPKQEGLYSICNAFGIPPEVFSEVSKKHGYENLKQPIYDLDSIQFKAMLADPEFQRIVIEHAKPSWDLLRRYLEQQHFFTDPCVALVDIGWNGSIQKFLQEAFGHLENYPHVVGHYLAFISGIKYSFDSDKNTLYGVMCDERGKARPEDVFSRFEEIFEEGARALHPTTIGYRLNPENGQVEPVLKEESTLDRRAEQRTNQRIAEFQEGIMAFAPEFVRALDLTGYRFDEIKPFMLTLAERAVAYPTDAEIHELMQLAHSEDFGFENVMDFSHERFAGWRALFHPRRMLRTLVRANWKYGTVGSLGIPGANMVVRLYDLLKRK